MRLARILLNGVLMAGMPAIAQAPAAPSTQEPSTGGVQILSDTQGVDFAPFLKEWRSITNQTWDKQIVNESMPANRPLPQKASVTIHFKVLPNGQVTNMILEGRSGYTALDRAAWNAIRGSSYPPLPREFHGPFLELRAVFMYNQRQ
jgi:TonB family protein